jgi:hypothetical protein
MPPFKKFGKKTIPFLLVAASIILSYFLLQQKNEIITLLIFVILIPIFVTVRFDQYIKPIAVEGSNRYNQILGSSCNYRSFYYRQSGCRDIIRK